MGTPVRTCTGCRARRPKDQLIRVVRGPDGVARLGEPGLAGRGGYTCPDEKCIRQAFASGRLARVLGCEREGLTGSLLGPMLQESKHRSPGRAVQSLLKGRAWQSLGFTK
jgi:predicted RNA-binding protein YlxR (DUF448 family)